jgi:hypothetical protein
MNRYQNLTGIHGLLVLTFTLFSCGGDSSGPNKVPAQPPPPPPPAVLPTLAAASGDGQTARIGQIVTTNPAVVVRNAQGQPVPGVQVSFVVESGGGSIQNMTAVTDASGTASAGSWRLGQNAGANVLVATSGTTQGGPVRFSANARLPYWTIMIFMAADNNLALSGVLDLEELESVQPNPDVQVVVQAEFSPNDLRQHGCASPLCIGRPNWNTFRYFVNPTGPAALGPSGPVIDIGNRRMTSALEVREFVQWSKQTYPAEKYAFVFWNHGGGYTGLLQDLTSSGSDVMSIGDLPVSFGTVGKIDIVGFDMCLMAGYETLSRLVGFTDYVVASEENEPGDGYPYDVILSALNTNPTMSARSAAGVIADSYHNSFLSDRASTTVSAYDMSGYVKFETSLNTLANTLRGNLAALAPVISDVASQTQSFSFVQFKDISDFLDRFRTRVNDPGILTQIDALRTNLDTGFRVKNHARRGLDANAPDMANATGLHFVLPSGIGADATADAGALSFTAYQALLSGKPYTEFLKSYLQNRTSFASTDQGNAAFQGYLVWDTASISKKADVDIWVLEPTGNLYIPYLGLVTPNGVFTADSYETGTSYEGYLTKRVVRNGRYKFYADLYTDVQNHRPVVDLAYRNGDAEFRMLYTGTTTPPPAAFNGHILAEGSKRHFHSHREQLLYGY